MSDRDAPPGRPQDAVAAMFDRAAQTYDQTGVELFQPIAARLVDLVAPRPGERAADLGCGRGAVLHRLARATGARPVGVDLAPAMVDAARADAAAAGLDVEVGLGDVQDPDLPAAAFDVVTASLVLFFLPDPHAALERWRALLAPGGRFATSTFGPLLTPWTVEEAFVAHLPPAAREGRARARSDTFSTTEGVEGLLRDAGWADVRTVTDVVRVRFTDAAQWERWTWSGGLRLMWEAIPPERHADVVRDATARLHECALPDGSLGFDQEFRVTLARRPEE